MQKAMQNRATARSEAVTSFEAAARFKEIRDTLRPALQLKAMERMPAAKALDKLQNFTHELYSERYEAATSNTPADSPTHIKRQHVYFWMWKYEPFWTLTDTVAMAWSAGLHPLTGNDEIAFLYYFNPFVIIPAPGLLIPCLPA